jgi:hypothetical protein
MEGSALRCSWWPNSQSLSTQRSSKKADLATMRSSMSKPSSLEVKYDEQELHPLPGPG